jgi:CheY-like chemotaxis protein/nitrogen-specific signal transduction histidine kinase
VYDYIFAPVLGADGKVVAVAGTTRDITERQAAEQALREQSLQLAASDRAKDEFLATLAHELRNPLAPLSNAIELCKRASDDRSLTHSAYVLMERQVRHLIRLVDDLMEVSRISRGAFTLRRERVEAAALVRTAVETSEPLIQAAGHELTIKLPSEPLWLDGDAVRLAQVISNLLNNAALYTDPGGRLRVTVQREGSEAVFGVADNGIGIDPDALPQLFEMFTRGSDSTRHRGGLGLGLPLSLRLAQLHGGTVQAHSAGPGCGSEFTLRVPAVADSPGAYVPADLRTQALPGMRVLVVDDNRDAADSLSLLLHLLGADARTVHGAREGLTLFDDWRPDAVLLDIGMPDMDGYDMARAIRQRAGGRSVRLVALTGWGQDDVRRKTKEAGIDHHLVKPAQIEALVQILRADQRG